MTVTCRELIERAYEREAGVVLAARVEKVLAEAEECSKYKLVMAPDRMLRLLNGEDTP